MARAPAPFPGRVIVGFDGSDHAVRALDRATDEAARRGTSLEIVCGWPWGKHTLPDFDVTDDTGKPLYSSARHLMDAATEHVRARAGQVAVSESLSAARAMLCCAAGATPHSPWSAPAATAASRATADSAATGSTTRSRPSPVCTASPLPHDHVRQHPTFSPPGHGLLQHALAKGGNKRENERHSTLWHPRPQGVINRKSSGM